MDEEPNWLDHDEIFITLDGKLQIILRKVIACLKS